MRSRPSLILAAAAAVLLTSVGASAQSGGQRGGQQGGQRSGGGADEARRARTRQEFEGGPQAALPGTRNLGPCPYVKVLYDAARYVELEGGREAVDAVGFTGEIQGIEAECEYVRPGEPIRVRMRVNFALGRGPRAAGGSFSYPWWVAVTERNRQVITREDFQMPVDFEGRDRTGMSQEIGEIVLPRANETVSALNYEILVGFQVTPEMAEFNRQGKRFRVGAGRTATAQPAAAAPAGGAAPQQ